MNRSKGAVGAAVVASIAVAGWVAPAKAASVTWVTSTGNTISGDSDVVNTGTPYGSWAPSDLSASAFPINGVTFNDPSNLPGFSALPDSANNDFGGLYDGFGSPGQTPDVFYTGLLYHGTFGGTAASFSFNVTPGTSYLVELWVNDQRAVGGRNETVQASTGGPLATLFYGPGGQYVIGNFTADITGVETIDFTAGAGATVQLNLAQVRVNPSEVPEPASLGMLGLGAVALLSRKRSPDASGLIRRNRKNRA